MDFLKTFTFLHISERMSYEGNLAFFNMEFFVPQLAIPVF